MTIADHSTAAAPVIPPPVLPRKPEPPKPGVVLVRAAESVPAHRLHHLEVTRRRMQLTDPDRHFLDVDADRSYAAMAAAHPELVTIDPTWQPANAKRVTA
ncbi:hypothetical protein QMK19_03155 [Streptomyces sp. H10-C2]|uniref:hypothetical protein n=1 Tax=unclassified Streptomyces TaxID=2593676 RepID=UPI0024BB6972|nr:MULTISPECIES: hypothetical protein [unclassified Streptomyces]MDJ0342183.1 hypothetical protein [Streptomyces sp. PH10-H1]MDJ0368697.1 hypothetical protein [Streptomyces sp. H10-C2]